MRKFIAAMFVMASIFASCDKENDTLIKNQSNSKDRVETAYQKGMNNNEPVLVININELHANSKKVIEYFRTFTIFSDLDDFRDIEYIFEEELQQGFIQSNAVTEEGNHVILRVEAELEDGFIKLQRAGSTAGESCTGVDCEHCAFKSTGGCECKSQTTLIGGHCNHSITR